MMDTIITALKYVGVDVSDFNLKNDMFKRPTHKPIHGIGHIYRTMICCALIGNSVKKPREALLAFCGAYIHDLARCTDGEDPEHGAQAVKEYFDDFSSIWNKYGLTQSELNQVKFSVEQHSRSQRLKYDDPGYYAAAILKDADALDRCRLRSGLNPDLLYFAESKSLIPVSEQIFKQTSEINDDICFADFVQLLNISVHTILENNKIDALYHFTDRSNLLSILMNEGLLSYRKIKKDGVSVQKYASSKESRQIDAHKNLDDYVRLSFCHWHPMMYVAKSEGRIDDPFVIEISPEVCAFADTKFSNINAASCANIQGGVSGLSSVDFKVVKSTYSKTFTDEEKALHQAEVLVRGNVPLKYFLNVDKILDQLTIKERDRLRTEVRKNLPEPSIQWFTQQRSNYVDEKSTFNFKVKNCTKVIINDKDISATEGTYELAAGVSTCRLVAINEITKFGETISKSVERVINITPYSLPIFNLTSDKLYVKKGQENIVEIHCEVYNVKSAILFVGSEQVELHKSVFNRKFNLSGTTNIYIEAVGLDNERRFYSKSLIIEGRYEAQINKFTTDKKYSIPDVPFLISWDVVYADKIYIQKDNEVISQHLSPRGQNYYVIKNKVILKLCAEDVFGVKSHTLELDLLPLPSIKYISIPLPEVNCQTTAHVTMNSPHLRESFPKIIGSRAPMFCDRVLNPPHMDKVDFRGREHSLKNIISFPIISSGRILWNRLNRGIQAIVNRITKTF